LGAKQPGLDSGSPIDVTWANKFMENKIRNTPPAPPSIPSLSTVDKKVYFAICLMVGFNESKIEGAVAIVKGLYAAFEERLP